MHMFSTGRIKASGAVLWRPAGAEKAEPESAAGAVELALIHRPRYDDWSFAKGKADPGEHAITTALREVEEETGLRCTLGRRLPSTEYEAEGRPKRVRYWAARPVESADTSWFSPNEEVDRLEWLTPAQARRRLSSELDLVVLEAFLRAPARTYPVILQRHAKAERRSSAWRDDLARPLAPHGHQQALDLAGLLAGYGDLRLISSPAVRCVSTVRPYAEFRDIEVSTDAALTEVAYVHAPRAVVGWLRDLVERQEGAIVCTHGPLLDELIAAVLYGPGFGGSSGLDDGPTLNGKPWDPATADRWANESISPGDAWVLHFAAGEGTAEDSAGGSPALVAVDRLKV